MTRRSPRSAPNPVRRPTPAAPTQMLRAGGLLGSLKIWQKLLLISATFLVPVLVLIATLYNTQQYRFGFTWNQANGTQYINLLYKGLVGVGEHRRNLDSLRMGQGSHEAVQQTAAGVDAALEALRTLDQKLRGTMGVSEQIAALQQSWSRLKSQASGMDSISSFEEHAALMLVIQRLIVQVSNNSQLVLDPEFDTYYLMQSVAFNIPVLLQDLDRLSNLGQGILTKRIANAYERAEVNALAVKIGHSSAELKQHLEFARQKNPQVGASLGETLNRAEGLTREAYVLAINEIVAPPRLSLSAQDYATAFDSATDSLTEYSFAALAKLANLLEERIFTLQRDQLVTFVLLALALGGCRREAPADVARAPGDPIEAVEALAGALRDNDLVRYRQLSLPPDLHARSAKVLQRALGLAEVQSRAGHRDRQLHAHRHRKRGTVDGPPDLERPIGTPDPALAVHEERDLVVLAGDPPIGAQLPERQRVASCLGDELITRPRVDGRRERLLEVRGKGGKQRSVPLSRSLAEELEAWLKLRLAYAKAGERHVLVNLGGRKGHGRGMSEKALRESLNRYYCTLGFPPRYRGAHMLRHTAGTRFYRASRDLHATARLLGHASVNTSAIYAKMDLEGLFEVVDRLEGE